jgi:hypothetical protein
LRALRLAFPQAQMCGIEFSWPLRFAAALRCPWARIWHGDIWQADWSGYDLVYVFQRPETMPHAVAKARDQLKPGAWLVSLEFDRRGPGECHSASLVVSGSVQAGLDQTCLLNRPDDDCINAFLRERCPRCDEASQTTTHRPEGGAPTKNRPFTLNFTGPDQ